MAQIFPQNPDAGALDEAQRALLETLSGLPDAWTLLCDRRIGETPLDAVLVHPEIGVALIDGAPDAPEAAREALRTQLEREGFTRFFGGETPIVAVSIAAAEIDALGERLAAAFDAAPRLAIADPDWADAVVELLLLPSDVTMTPTTAFAAPAGALRAEEPPAEAPELRRPHPVPPPPLLLDDYVAPARLSADEPIAYEPAVHRRPPWLAGAVLAGLMVVGGIVAWGLSDNQPGWGGKVDRSAAEVKLPLAAPASPPPAPPAPEQAAAPPPPPAPPPVMMAAKPMAEPPPAAPRPTAIPPLPQPAPSVAEQTPPAPAPAPATVATETPPAAAAPAAEPAPAPAAKPKPRRTVQAERPAKPRVARAEPEERPAARSGPDESSQLMRRELGNDEGQPSSSPPIDAADLPPLEPAAAATPPAPAPSPPVSEPPLPQAPVIGAPVRLTRQHADATGSSGSTALPEGECRPYTADTTLTGRSTAVEGIACRGSDGEWRLVSEVPRH